MNDYLRSLKGRKQKWFGLKLPVKAALAQPYLHPMLRTVAPHINGIKVGRLPAPIGLTEVRGRAGGAGFYLVDPFRCEIAKEFYWGKGRRTEAEDAFALDLMVELSRDADVFLDIGAYTGVFTMAVLAANQTAVAHSFEIIPAVVTGLEKNVARNHLGDRVTVHPTGVGKPGTTMQVPTGDGGSALPSFYGTGMDFDSGAQVRFTSLDELLPDLPPGRPQVTVKIDVEGAENDVLGNGRELLGTLQPDILCEVLDDRAQPEQLMRILDRFDYHYYLVGDDHLSAHDEIVPDPHFRDWLFSTKNPEDMRVAGYPVR
ncbi:FkbM family methyltransferase [Brevibacterium sp. UCMA 11754]|uniref:FkbM family methyltransferase n=1 Tax=Brevibacterium sp. UCMA 11754 TaxID=2749198 RepID=UPI001F02A93D|nr:FkbM family methyltransferase [Brevibacterium sp. UCMA 11754]MCF2572245.1 FkbM family methyltransferase [Brevibacterium sp. UCMA 11754]